MPQCLIPHCNNNADNNLGIRCRRQDTSAIWAPNCNAYLCDEHAGQGYSIDITLTPVVNRTITTNVSVHGFIARRTTDINHEAIE